jgi:hypothetical protein
VRHPVFLHVQRSQEGHPDVVGMALACTVSGHSLHGFPGKAVACFPDDA